MSEKIEADTDPLLSSDELSDARSNQRVANRAAEHSSKLSSEKRSQPLLLGVNCRFFSAQMTGVERYAHNVLEHLISEAAARAHRIVLIVPKSCMAQLPSFTKRSHVKIVETAISDSFSGRHFWEQMILPMIATRLRVNYLINLTNTCPVLFRNNILTLHDVSWLHRPAWFSKLFAIGYSAVIPAAVRGARKVITVSEYSRKEISSKLKHDSNLCVITEGVSDEFKPVSKQERDPILLSFGIDRPYLLHVGTLQPRKNLPRLIQAYQALLARVERPPLLVLAGGSAKHFGDQELENAKANPNVRLIGYVEDSLLPALYSGALGYVSASLYEGFGLTPLEAMACGAPVAVSDLEPHQEVVGDAALLFDPNSVDAITAALEKLCVNNQLRQELIEKGFARITRFSWKNHASEILDIVEGFQTGQ